MRWVFGLSDAGPSQTPWLLPPPSVHFAYSKTSLKHRLNTAHHDDTTSVSVVGVTLQLDGVPTADVTMETSNRLTVSKLKQDSKMKAFVGIEYNSAQLKWSRTELKSLSRRETPIESGCPWAYLSQALALFGWEWKRKLRASGRELLLINGWGQHYLTIKHIQQI